MAFSKFKTFLKQTAAQNIDGLWHAIARAIDILTPNKRRNYFAAAGYEPE